MRVLLVQTGFLGDVVLSMPVVDALRRIYPMAEIFLLTTPAAAGLVQDDPRFKEVLVFDKRKSDSGMRGLLRIGAKLRSYKFNLAFSLHKSWRTACLLCLAQIPHRYGFSEAAGTFLYSRCAPRSDLSHEVLRNLAILRNLELDPNDFAVPLSLSIPQSVQEVAGKTLQDLHSGPWVALAPGSVWPTKRWTPQGFAACAQHFSAKGYGVVLLGGEGDRQSGEEIEACVKTPVLNLIGKVDLLQSAALIAESEVLITNDSAPLHIAAAKQTPVVAAFCATVPEFGFGPWQVPAEVVGVAGLNCRPCGRHGGKTCPTGTHACQLQLSSTEVINAAERLLKSKVKEQPNQGVAR